MKLLFHEGVVFDSISAASSVNMRLFSLTLVSVFCCFLSSCDAIDYKVIVETGDTHGVTTAFVEYEIPVYTSKCIEGVGTGGKVYITLYGEKGNSSKIRLHKEGKPEFQNCTVNIFDIKTEDIGLLSKIRVELDNTELSNNDNWLLKEVSVLDETREIEATFYLNEWLNTTVNQKTVSTEIERLSGHIFKVIVETGDLKDAGTNCSVYITLRRDIWSFTYELDHIGKLLFQKGQTDTFYISTKDDVPTVADIGIELDCTGLRKNDNWFLKAVSFEDLERKLDLWFPWNRWLTPPAKEKTILVWSYPQPHRGKQ